MEKKKSAIIVNLISGPGVGKSIISAELFAKFKREYIACDISWEYIKKKLREKSLKAVQSQIYIFGKQQFQLFSMKDEVDVIVTDSPLILSAVYDKTQCSSLKELVLKEFNSYNNITYFIERDKNIPYEQEGRYQDLEGAKKIDEKVKDFMNENNIKYISVNGIGKDSLNKIVNDVKKELKNNCYY